MLDVLPSVFISHGPPDRILGNAEAKQFLFDFSQRIKKPNGIVIISAHWLTRDLYMSKSGPLSAMYDFSGFSQQLYDIRYDTHQSEWLEEKVLSALQPHTPAVKSVERQLDHGCWSILKLAYPKKDIPVSVVSLPIYNDFNDYLVLGAMLKKLREDNILIIGSGSATHNLRELYLTNSRPKWADEFVSWLQQAVKNNDYHSLCNIYECAPFASTAHPSIEHYLPLLVAAGAAQEESTELIHDSYELGSLNNSSFFFGNQIQPSVNSL